MKTPDSILKKLEQRKENDSYRELIIKGDRIDFFSNDYLGLASLPTKGEGNYGATGSRLISGNSNLHIEAERFLAVFFEAEAALLFNSGYDANLGLLSSVPQRGDTVLYDELIHASVRDGLRLGVAKSFSFKHNNTVHLKELLDKAEGNVFVVTESVYSMDGDCAPLSELVSLCDERGAYLIVDEAHAAGVFGLQGKGLCANDGMEKKIFARVVTFGKAYGSHGAVVLGSGDLRTFLINFARSLIYTTALSPHSCERIMKAVSHVAALDEARENLFSLVNYFKSEAAKAKLNIGTASTPIQMVLIPGNERVREVAEHCLQNGLAVKAILAPTVPEGKERIRICIHSFNTRDQIDHLINCLK